MHGRFCGKRLLGKKKCRDHNQFTFFSRARNGVLRPDASTLSFQLSDENITKLIKSEGTMILYQHLGAIRKRSNEFPYLDLNARRALNKIAEKYHDKIIWVAPTSEILAYAHLLENIELGVVHNQEALIIEVMNKHKARRHFGLSELKNLSFRVKNYQGNKIELKCGDYSFKRAEYETFEDEGIVIKLYPGAGN